MVYFAGQLVEPGIEMEPKRKSLTPLAGCLWRKYVGAAGDDLESQEGGY